MAVASTLLLFVSYIVVFRTTTDDSTSDLVVSALTNTLPAAGLAVIWHLFLTRHVWPKRAAVQLAAQLPLAVLFAIAWYFGVLVAQGARGGWLESGFAVRPFVPVAFVWQMFQGLTLYAVAALFSQTVHLRRTLARLQGELAQRPGRPPVPSGQPLLLRQGGEAQSVQPDDIVRISGAGDGVNIVLATRRLSSNSTLGELESALPAEQFVRAHRSHLIRLAAIVRTESAGNGRTTLHLTNGEAIVTSRAGSREVRDRSL